MQLIIDRTENLLSQRKYSNVTPWLQPGTGRGVWLSNRHVNLSGNKECLVQKYLYCLDYNTITKVLAALAMNKVGMNINYMVLNRT